MRVLQIYKNFNASKGGVERHIDGLSNTISSNFKITYFYKISDKDANFNVKYKTIKSKYFNFIKYVFDSDVIHIHGARFLFNLKFFFLAKILNKKIIYTPHCYYDGRGFLNDQIKKIWDLTIEKIFYKFSNKIVLLNNFWMEYAKLKNFNIKNTTIIPNCVIKNNHREIKSETSERGIKNIISISRIDKVKRIEDVIKVIIKFKDKYVFHIVGEGPELKNLKKKYADQSNIKFYGFIKDDELQKILEIIDAYIIASEKEGMPTTIIEMILSNIPVIASDIPGNIAILKDLNEKFIFKLGNYNELSKILEKGNFNIDYRLRENVIKNYTWENKVKEIEKIYES